MNGVMGMSRIEELEKQITELDERKVALQHELELEKQKTEFEYPFEEREQYFVLCNDGRVASDCWEDYDCELAQWSQGNIFKTKEAAERERDKRALLTRFRQFRDKCNGEWKPGAFECKYFIAYDSFKNVLESSWNDTWDNFHTFGYFEKKEDCERAIRLFGDEIKRLYVEE